MLDSTRRSRLLVVEGDIAESRRLRDALAGLPGADTMFAATSRQARRSFGEWQPDAMLLDVELPNSSAVDVIREVRRSLLPCPIVAMSGAGSLGRAVEAVRDGAWNVLFRPFDAERLRTMARSAAERGRLLRRLAELEGSRPVRELEFVGNSPSMKKLTSALRTASRGKLPLLVVGEKGTGRESVARRIHGFSRRASGPFRTYDPVETLPANDAAAFFARALRDSDGGTLHIAELRRLGLAAQKMLRNFIERGRIDQSDVSWNVRIVAATDESPGATGISQTVDYRLTRLFDPQPVFVPPLRERREDIVHLAEAAMRGEAENLEFHFESIAPDAREALLAHAWPGNVSELLETLGAIAREHRPSELRAEMLPRYDADTAEPESRGPEAAIVAPVVRPLWKIEKEAIEEALDACGGNVAQAAAMLEISPATIYRKEKLWANEAKVRTA